MEKEEEEEGESCAWTWRAMTTCWLWKYAWRNRCSTVDGWRWIQGCVRRMYEVFGREARRAGRCCGVERRCVVFGRAVCWNRKRGCDVVVDVVVGRMRMWSGSVGAGGV